MKHFKSGADVVVVEAVADFRVGDTHTIDYVDGYGRVWLDCGGWLQAKRLRLVEQDDPLPPAPRCVRYNEGAEGFPFEVKSLVENSWHPNRIRLGVLCGDRDITHKYVVLDPDAALQLAHDLNRMANEIKRRERAQSGE